MTYPYFPGCTLNTKAKSFDTSTKKSAESLGLELEEIPDWTCCGTTYPLVDQNIMNLVAPYRNLQMASEMGDCIVTLCSFCYNVLKRTNNRMKEDKDALKILNDFVEKDYDGSIEVLHLLELIRNKLGFDKLTEKVKKSLKGLKVAPYYGCLVVRPKSVAFDDGEEPVILDDFLTALGAEVIWFPHKTECCGSYHSVRDMGVIKECSLRILQAVKKAGAEAIAVTCPLCHYNLDRIQSELAKDGFEPIPVLYFTQLLGIALGLSKESCDFQINKVRPEGLLKKKKLIG